MKFANLVLQSPIIRSRHDLLPAAGRDQAALRHQPTPGEQLVWGNAMPTSHQAYRHTRLEGLFDHANLLRGRPAPTPLNRRDDLNAIGAIVRRHVCMPHSCSLGDCVRSVRGLSQHGVAPNQLFTWRRLVAQGSLTAAGSGEEVVPTSDYRVLQNQVRELHRLLGKKTLEAEILKEALEHATGSKKQLRLPPSPPKDGSR